MQQSVTTIECLAQRLHVNLIHLRDRVGSGPASRTTVPVPASPNHTQPNGSSPKSPSLTAKTNPSEPDCATPTDSDPTPSEKKKRGKRRDRLKSAGQSEPTSPESSTTANHVNNTVSTPVGVPVVREYLLRRETPADDFVDVRRSHSTPCLLLHVLMIDNFTVFDDGSKEVVTFIDLAGHERYLKTTIFGMTGHAPDYAMFMVGANAGVIGMAKEHLGLALALGVPVFVVVTKIDMCPPNVLQETMNLLVRILKSPGCRKIPILISSK
ncbi:unnamed protein product [Echinostoma caproni]|uniref:Tr-type G domain-containing protein n=1 Tax=Echinostoma caproni TaxID=27848 RepID=A0A3P8H4S2_9TREM|nr:unnamed protein product [Echinostoma caproni]